MLIDVSYSTLYKSFFFFFFQFYACLLVFSLLLSLHVSLSVIAEHFLINDNFFLILKSSLFRLFGFKIHPTVYKLQQTWTTTITISTISNLSLIISRLKILNVIWKISFFLFFALLKFFNDAACDPCIWIFCSVTWNVHFSLHFICRKHKYCELMFSKSFFFFSTAIS